MDPDFLVIGAGVAGLRAAIDLAAAGAVLVVAKESLRESSSEYAQGGVAVAGASRFAGESRCPHADRIHRQEMRTAVVAMTADLASAIRPRRRCIRRTEFRTVEAAAQSTTAVGVTRTGSVPVEVAPAELNRDAGS